MVVVVKVDKVNPVPVKNVNVYLTETGSVDATNEIGQSRFVLPSNFKAGDKIQFVVNENEYAIYEPTEGFARIPSEPAKEKIEIKLLPFGSPKFLTHDQLTKLIGNAAEKTRSHHDDQQFELSRFVREWALKYGFSIEQVEVEVARWRREVETQGTNLHELGLLEFVNRDYVKAVEYFKESAEISNKKLENIHLSIEKVKENLVKDYELIIESYDHNHQFDSCLTYLEKVESLLKSDSGTINWARMMFEKGSLLCHLSEHDFYSNPDSLLLISLESYRKSLSVLKREEMPMIWALTQHNIGITIAQIAKRQLPQTAVDLYYEAIDSLRVALEVRKSLNLEYESAFTQYMIGSILAQIGERESEPELKRNFFLAASDSLEKVLLIFSQEKYPDDWAKALTARSTALTQLTLAELEILSHIKSDSISTGHRYMWLMSTLSEAIFGYKNTLLVFRPETQIDQWLVSQSNLGCALMWYGFLNERSGGIIIIDEGIDTINQAINRIDKNHFPSIWGISNYYLGRAYMLKHVKVGSSQEMALLDKAQQYLAEAEVSCALSPDSFLCAQVRLMERNINILKSNIK